MANYSYEFGPVGSYCTQERFLNNLRKFYDNPDEYGIEPFQIFGNLYYVGDRMVTSHLIDTGEGLILFDTGYGQTTHMLLNSIRALGFDPMDIRYIIHSHGHFDHFGSGNELRALTGAKVFMSGVDTRNLREMPERALLSWGPRPEDPVCWPDVEIEDGDHIRLGNTDITCILSPGHTCGTMTFFFDVTDGEKTLRVGYFGGAGLQTMYKEHCLRYNLPLDRGQKMLQTLHKLLPQHVDIMLGNHPSQNRTLEKRRNMLEHPGENDFLDSTAWQQFFTAYIRLVEEFLALGC